MTNRKFYKTVYTIEVLSDTPLSESLPLSDVDYAITYGDCSGKVTREQTELNGQQAADALREQGSSTEFFRLDDFGNDSDSDETQNYN